MNELGNLLSKHKENTTATGSTLLVGIICFGLSALMVGFFFSEKGITFDRFLFAIGGIFAFIGGVGCLLSFLKNYGGSVELYENGLIAKKRGKKHHALWNEIAVVKESIEKMYLKGSYVYDRYLYTIEKQNGEIFQLSNMVSKIDQIGEVIKTKTLENLYPIAKEKINNGEQILFDSLSLDKNCLAGFKWALLSSLKVKDDLIKVKDKTGKVIVKGAYSSTPNAHLLIKLLKEHLSLEL